MNNTLDTSTEELVGEITRYLAAVDVFRAEGREPIWRPELLSAAIGPPRSAVSPTLPSDVSLH